jgi:CBS domain-containing protein
VRRVTIEEAFQRLAAMTDLQIGPLDGEAVCLNVRGGEVVAVVAEETPEDEAVAAASLVRATIRLDNEQVLTIEIQDGGSGAYFADQAAQLQRAGQPVAPGPLPVHDLGPVGAVMTRDVKTATPDELVEDVAKRLVFHNVTGLPVEDWDGRIVGIVSEMDVIGRIGDIIRDVMTTDVISVKSDEPVERVAALMAERGIKRVPVIEEGKLVGIISRADIVRLLAERWAEG